MGRNKQEVLSRPSLEDIRLIKSWDNTENVGISMNSARKSGIVHAGSTVTFDGWLPGLVELSTGGIIAFRILNRTNAHAESVNFYRVVQLNKFDDDGGYHIIGIGQLIACYPKSDTGLNYADKNNCDIIAKSFIKYFTQNPEKLTEVLDDCDRILSTKKPALSGLFKWASIKRFFGLGRTQTNQLT